MYEATMAAAALANTGGEFNSTPFIIGAIVLVALGGAALLVMRIRGGKRTDDERDI